ncbi:hypothetical protein GIB67_042367 [Kingdonia uniflora]|uniref:Uncharacterized protein n=1 Tax=Kingdonia uniflora TaxID=39325 RepID=A0A7J7MEW7_9MAGN|nr:hypothetical protein GIB67_042367 [Kingdonia uniflora]
MENVNIAENVESDSLNKVFGFGGGDGGGSSVASKPPSQVQVAWEEQVLALAIQVLGGNGCLEGQRRALQVVVELYNPCEVVWVAALKLFTFFGTLY